MSATANAALVQRAVADVADVRRRWFTIIVVGLDPAYRPARPPHASPPAPTGLCSRVEEEERSRYFSRFLDTSRRPTARRRPKNRSCRLVFVGIPLTQPTTRCLGATWQPSPSCRPNSPDLPRGTWWQPPKLRDAVRAGARTGWVSGVGVVRGWPPWPTPEVPSRRPVRG